MKKILFHINSLGKGGAERVVSVLANEFSKDGNQVLLATEWTADEEYEVLPEVKRIHVGLSDSQEKKGRMGKALARFSNLRKCIREEKPDVVIAFCNKASYRTLVAMRGLSTPFYFSVRNDPKVYYTGTVKSFLNIFLQKKAAGCIFQTKQAMEFFSEELQKKSTIIVNPLDEKYLQAKKAVERDHRIITAGRISTQKNQLLLCKAFLQVVNEYPEYELCIYGDVEEPAKKEELEAFINEHHMQEKIKLCGLSHDTVRDFSKASMFVLPSDFEGMPNALMEAMAMGIPCVATDCPCGGSRMLIEDGIHGYLTPVGEKQALADAMKKILSDTKAAEGMAERGKEKIEKMAETKAVYQQWKTFVGV